MSGRLTTERFWETAWSNLRLPATWRPPGDIIRILCSHLPHCNTMTLLEVGCAPGGRLAFFHNRFGYRISGVEYIPAAARATERNLEMQGIAGTVIHADFFQEDAIQSTYDVVVSAGFVEHFDNLDAVVARICSLAKVYVITSIPNLYGLNALLFRLTRPADYAAHKRISRGELRRVHEQCGLETLYCDYVGGINFVSLVSPATKGFRRALMRLLNTPFRAVSIVSGKTSGLTGFYPRARFFCSGLMYVGRRPDNL